MFQAQNLLTIFSHSRYKIIAVILYSLPLFFLIKPWTHFLLFFVGGVCGLALLLADEFALNRYYNDPEAVVDPKDSDPGSHEKDSAPPPASENTFLATRSALFLFAFIPLSFFVITSTGSFLGIGLVLGMFAGLLQEMWQYKNQPEVFNLRFWSQVKTKLTAEQIKLGIFLLSFYFLFLNFIFLR